MNAASLFDQLVPQGWPTLVFVLSRVVGMMLTAPAWSMEVIPSNVRVAAALALTLAVLPAAPTVVLPDHVVSLVVPMAIELVIGLLIGLTASLFIYGITVAGEVVSVQMGLAIANTLAPGSGISGAGVGMLKSLMALTLYVTLGGHLFLIAGFAESLQVIPPGGGASLPQGGFEFALLAGTLFETAVRVAAPLMAAMMLANTILAILSRAVPQINTLMVAFPITIGLGFVVFAASIPFLARLVQEWIGNVPSSVASTVQLLAPAP